MEFQRNVMTAEGLWIHLRFGVWRCAICGEVYLGLDPPSHCPFCGSGRQYLVSPELVAEDRDVISNLSESDKANLVESVRLESGDIRYYLTMSKRGKVTDGDLRAMYDALAKIETEHCEIFSRLMLAKMPSDLDRIVEIGSTWRDSVKASSERECKAHEIYTRFAKATSNSRLRQVWTSIAGVELEHYVFEMGQLDTGRLTLEQI